MQLIILDRYEYYRLFNSLHRMPYRPVAFPCPACVVSWGVLDCASFAARGRVMRNPLLEVTPVLPASLKRLPELTGNLFFSWHRPARALFEDLDPELWQQTGGNPRLMLRCLSQSTLDSAAEDSVYLARYSQVLQTLDAYLSADSHATESPLVAYFCA